MMNDKINLLILDAFKKQEIEKLNTSEKQFKNTFYILKLILRCSPFQYALDNKLRHSFIFLLKNYHDMLDEDSQTNSNILVDKFYIDAIVAANEGNLDKFMKLFFKKNLNFLNKIRSIS
jgi:hypothetical protein